MKVAKEPMREYHRKILLAILSLSYTKIIHMFSKIGLLVAHSSDAIKASSELMLSRYGPINLLDFVSFRFNSAYVIVYLSHLFAVTEVMPICNNLQDIV